MPEGQENQGQEDRDKKQRQLAADFKMTFTRYAPGIKVYEYLEKLCLKNSQTFAPSDSYITAFNCGAREVILRIDDMIDMADEKPKQTEAINKEI